MHRENTSDLADSSLSISMPVGQLLLYICYFIAWFDQDIKNAQTKMTSNLLKLKLDFYPACIILRP